MLLDYLQVWVVNVCWDLIENGATFLLLNCLSWIEWLESEHVVLGRHPRRLLAFSNLRQGKAACCDRRIGITKVIQEIYICCIRLSVLQRAASCSAPYVFNCKRSSCDLALMVLIELNGTTYIHLEGVCLRGRFVLEATSVLLLGDVELAYVNDLGITFLSFCELNVKRLTCSIGYQLSLDRRVRVIHLGGQLSASLLIIRELRVACHVIILLLMLLVLVIVLLERHIVLLVLRAVLLRIDCMLLMDI